MSEKLFDVTGKVIVITGGGGALGSTMVKYLLKQGAKIVVISRSTDSVQKIVKEAESMGEGLLGLAVDVLDEGKLKEARATVLEKYKTVDVLINAAGGNLPGATVPPDKTVFDVSIGDLKKVLDLNLMGSVLPTLIFGEVMARQGRGSVINISSMAASQSISRVLGYSMAKSGIDIFTKWMALELAAKFGDGVRVNAIAPGFFIGKQNHKLLLNEDGSFTDRGETIINNTPMKRFGEAEELNGIVLYLCSDASQFVTGTIIPVDGGFSSFSGV